MPYRVCKTIDIENGHLLTKHPDKCRFPHGHTRKVEFVLEAETLDDRDMVCDFKVLRELMEEYLDSLDHAMCVNTADPAYAEMKERYGDRIIGFENQDPTTEAMAGRIFMECERRMAAHVARADARYPLRAGVRLVSVRVWETATSWAEFSRGSV